jgi:arylsulfatase A-like enzyme
MNYEKNFKGKIGRTREESTPWWPEQTKSEQSPPNIIVILMDDMGWSDPGCFGSEINTPNIDHLATKGVRLVNYTTHPICSPARAALLTGCNAHSVGTGWLTNNHPGFPGYSGEIPLDAATLPETLRDAGYETIMVGKWHNTPFLENVPGGDKSTWPTQRGFDTFYGFMDGETSHFFPSRLMLNNQVLPVDQYPSDYYTGDDWMNQGIRFIKELRESKPCKPFFLYVANNAMHAPHQSKVTDIAKYQDIYSKGWTKIREDRFEKQKKLGLVPIDAILPPSDPQAPHWDTTEIENRRLYAHHMQAYAGMMDNADQNIGKLYEFLRDIGELDNTLIVFTSDNGGTGLGTEHGMINNKRRNSGLPPNSPDIENKQIHKLGGPQSHSLYPTAWGEVSNTPFPSFKTYTGGGGRRVSFIISYPRKIKTQGDIQNQFMHVTDLMPTILNLAEIPQLKKLHGYQTRKIDGLNFSEVFISNSKSPRTEQYYECWSNRAYFKEGWLARSLQKRGTPIDFNNWTLHHLEKDFTESTDLSDQHPERLSQLVAAFDQAAWEYFVYPLDNRNQPQKLNDTPAHFKILEDQPRRFLPGSQTVVRTDLIPLVSNRSFQIKSKISQRPGDQGVIWALGDLIAGIVMYVEADHLNIHYNGFGVTVDFKPVPIDSTMKDLVFEYQALGERQGQGRIIINGKAESDWINLSPTIMYGPFEGLDVGLDRRSPVLWDLYERHGVFRYSGNIEDVWIFPGARAEK